MSISKRCSSGECETQSICDITTTSTITTTTTINKTTASKPTPLQLTTTTPFKAEPCPTEFHELDWTERENSNGHCIKILSPMQYSHAHIKCCEEGGNLARIENGKINQKIAELAPIDVITSEVALMWIGYTDVEREGYFVDFDNRSPPYRKWGTSMEGRPLPDNVIKNGIGQNCVAINYRMRGLWDDQWCFEKYY